MQILHGAPQLLREIRIKAVQRISYVLAVNWSVEQIRHYYVREIWSTVSKEFNAYLKLQPFVVSSPVEIAPPDAIFRLPSRTSLHRYVPADNKEQHQHFATSSRSRMGKVWWAFMSLSAKRKGLLLMLPSPCIWVCRCSVLLFLVCSETASKVDCLSWLEVRDIEWICIPGT